ncbi:MAG TPA: chorismate synthase [Longimicrobiales bacterium]|nr:chorismate synthase [Longimicrobiales bacterium]
MKFEFRTAGESHGKGLVSLVEGVPAGLEISAEKHIDPELRRRQGGYGRGGRMKIEQDRVEFVSGVRLGETFGAPLAMLVWNRDWENWQTAMSAEAPGEDASDTDLRRVHLPRPGHADLVGVLKYGREDARDILERASARETTARVAAGAVAKRFLDELGVSVGSHIVRLGDVEAKRPETWPEDLNAASDPSPLRTLDPDAEARMIEAVDAAQAEGDTLGGVFEVVATGLPAGLGSYVAWDRRLDGRLAGALMSIQAMKGVEIGLGFEAARRRGSGVHDEIEFDPAWNLGRTGGYRRRSNNAGGLEGGITTGAPLVARVAMKPLSSLMKPLRSVDLRTRERADAIRERSDVAALAAAGVVGEAMVAIVLADAMLEKFGGDSMAETRRNLDGYMADLERRSREIRERTDDEHYESGAL